MANNCGYAEDDEEAQSRYTKYRNVDPFPSIESALLNTADIADYVRETGMIYPFYPEKIKSASYEMDLGGEILFWDEEDREYNRILRIGQEIILRKNSITFVTVNSKFRLPDYIAMRFNLQLEHVHRGILLGTGPLINPGFCGNLMIPMHNLTSNDYVIKCGDPLIGVEFTKISSYFSWNYDGSDLEKRVGSYNKNHGKKNDKIFKHYIEQNVPRGKIVKSSLSGTIDKANKSVRDAQIIVNNTKEFVNRYKNISIISGITVLIALLALFYQVYDIVSSANSYVATANQRIAELQKADQDLKKRIIVIEKRIK